MECPPQLHAWCTRLISTTTTTTTTTTTSAESASSSGNPGGGGINTAVGPGGLAVEASQEPDGVIRAYRFDDSRDPAPIVALQADDRKLVTASEDGKGI